MRPGLVLNDCAGSWLFTLSEARLEKQGINLGSDTVTRQGQFSDWVSYNYLCLVLEEMEA